MIASASPPETNSNTIRKMKPVAVPIQTQYIMIFGPSTEAFGISSIM
jgi:hypothetical protein